jgi:hypothetical protein
MLRGVCLGGRQATRRFGFEQMQLRSNFVAARLDETSLYRRLTAHGLKKLKCFPQLVSVVPGSERIERYQQQVLAALTPAEAATWHQAVATAERDGTLFIAQPYHCAVAIKPG